MDDAFFAYLQRLELMAFFSGYPLLYAGIHFIAGNQPAKKNFKSRIASLLPFAYALVGSLYLGLQFKNLYPDYSIENIKQTLQPFLKIWGLLAILFWIPALAKRPFVSLLHSLIFFFFLIKDLVVQLAASSADKDMVRNDMKLYTDSLLVNLGALITITLFYFFLIRVKSYKNSSRS
jgi:hypothetical protein